MIEERIPPSAPPGLAEPEAEIAGTFRIAFHESGRSRLLWKALLSLLVTGSVVSSLFSLLIFAISDETRRLDGLTWIDIWLHPGRLGDPNLLIEPLSVLVALAFWYPLIVLAPRAWRSIRRRRAKLTVDGQGLALEGPHGDVFFAWRDIRRLTVITSRGRLTRRHSVLLDPLYDPDLPVRADAERHEPHLDPDSGWVVLTRIDGFRHPASKIEAGLRSHAGERRFRPALSGTEVQLVRRTETNEKDPSATAVDPPKAAATRVDGQRSPFRTALARCPRVVGAVLVTAVLVLVPVARAAGRPAEPHLAAVLLRPADPDEDTDFVHDAIFSPDGTLIAASLPNGVGLWNTAARRYLATLDTAFVPKYLAFSKDGRLLAVSGDDGIQLWEPTSHRLVRTLSASDVKAETVDRPNFSPSGKELIAEAVHTPFSTGHEPNKIAVWDVAGGKPTKTIPNTASSATLSPDGLTLATFGNDGDVQLLDTGTWRLRTTIHRSESANCVQNRSTLAFSRDSRLLSSCSTGGRVLDTRTGLPISAVVPDYSGNQANTFGPDRRTIAVSNGANLQFADLRTGRLIFNTLAPDGFGVTDLDFNRDGRMLLTSGNGLYLWTVPRRG